MLAPKDLKLAQRKEPSDESPSQAAVVHLESSDHNALYKSGVFNPTVNSLYGYLLTALGPMDE